MPAAEAAVWTPIWPQSTVTGQYMWAPRSIAMLDKARAAGFTEISCNWQGIIVAMLANILVSM
jgi:hypothetical protein